MKTTLIKKLLGLAFLVGVLSPLAVLASANEQKLDHAPDKSRDQPSLQNGAKLFVNYCMGCHGASFVRYNRLKEIGLTEEQIKQNLMFTEVNDGDKKIGDTMSIAMNRKDAKLAFGSWPPDLSLVARSRASGNGSGADWLYTYLRGFYRDDSRPTGWNNVAFSNVGMPHALYELQGEQEFDGHKLKLVKPGKMTPAEYDSAVADLVGYLVWMGEPKSETRKSIGIYVLLYLSLFLLVAYLLKREYWKDVH